MIIGGLQKFSLLDYPGRISAIVFTKKCNFRCHFCYNPMLVWPAEEVSQVKNISSSKRGIKNHPLIKEDDFFNFLKTRIKKLEAIVVTGGEPTLYFDLPEFIAKIKVLGYLVKLDTNGTNPNMIKKLINEKLIDYIAMDIKAPEEKYAKVVGAKVNFKKIEKSVKIIKESGLPYEFRTTLVPGLLDKGDIAKIGKIIKGANKWYLQKFKSDIKLVDSKFEKLKPFSDKEMMEMKRLGSKFVDSCYVR